MKAKNLITVAVVSAALSFSVAAQAKEEKHEEQTINSSDVPAAVQQAAKAEAKGGSIVRWEKEGANYEAVIEKNGKQIGVEMDANGKVLSKHDEAKSTKRRREPLICGWIALGMNSQHLKCAQCDQGEQRGEAA